MENKSTLYTQQAQELVKKGDKKLKGSLVSNFFSSKGIRAEEA